MKKLLFILLLFIPIHSFALLGVPECDSNDATVNINGCSVSNNNTSYNLSGDVTGIGEAGVNDDDGIIITGTSNTVNFIGNILVNDAYGLNFTATSSSNIFEMIGNISSVGTSSYGAILNSSSNNTLTLTGNIEMTGDYSFGINIRSSDFNTITYAGDIAVNYNLGSPRGFNLAGSDNNSIFSSGNISSSSSNAYGVHIDSSNSNTVTMNSNISLTGSTSDGIYIEGASNSITLNGNISTSASTSNGIQIEYGTGNTIHIFGNIFANSLSNAIVINGVSSNNEIIIEENALITGDINNNGTGDATLKINHGTGKSYAYRTSGNWNISDLNNRPIVTGSAYAMGVGIIETAAHELYQRNYQLNQSLNDRLLAYHNNNASPYWIDTYYGHNGRGNNSDLSSNNQQFSNHRNGVNLGYRVDKWEQPIEVLFNYEASNISHDNFSHKINSDSFMLGLLLPNAYKLHNGNLSFKTFIGLSDNRGDRTVLTNHSNYNGFRNVGSNFNSKYIMVGADWIKTLFQNEKFKLNTLVGLGFNNQFTESYNEESYFKINSRSMTQLESKILLLGSIKPYAAYPFEISANLGIENRNLVSGKQQKYEINNTNVNYTHSNTHNTYYSAGFGLNYKIKPSIDVYLNYKTYNSEDNIYYSSGNLGISGTF